MTDFPVRGQQAPNFWNEQLQAYIDERDTANANSVTALSQSVASALTGYWTKTESDSRFATAAQGAKADSAVQPAGLTKSAVGLGNVDNTSDANKPVSTAQSTAIAAVLGGTGLGTADLDTIQTAGVYGQATAANATLARHYPVANMAGTLEVQVVAAGAVTQRMIFQSGSGTTAARSIYIRRLNNAVWDSWKTVPTQRVNQPVGQPGVEVFTWDDVNGAERQVGLVRIGIPNGVDLNTVQAAGTYTLDPSYATLALNYPAASMAGVLEVLMQSTPAVVQRITAQSGSGSPGRGIYIRRLNGGNWDPWRFISYQRINQPAGEPGAEVFTWDDVNNIERQLPAIGMNLGTTDLDLVLAPGVYRQDAPANATLAAHYPTPTVNTSGVMEVLRDGTTGATISQRYTPRVGGTQTARAFYMRSYAGGAWQAWRSFTSQRVNQPAGEPGVEIFTWDDVNGIERQMAPVAISISTQHLDTIRTPGQYAQGSGANSTTANGYPLNLAAACVLEVIPMGSFRIQRLTVVTTNAPGAAGMYQRSWNTTTWGPWKFIASQRVDQTAGRAVYAWDDVNSREQLIYGDTGLRSIPGQLQNGWTATDIFIRRSGYDVTLHIEALNAAAMTAANFISVPTGFAPVTGQNIARGVLHTGTSPAAMYRTTYPGSNVFNLQAANTTFPLLYGTISYRTSEAWPTTLPGAAVGTIPNL